MLLDNVHPSYTRAGIRMCHNLLLNYRLYEKMDVFVMSRPGQC